MTTPQVQESREGAVTLVGRLMLAKGADLFPYMAEQSLRRRVTVVQAMEFYLGGDPIPDDEFEKMITDPVAYFAAFSDEDREDFIHMAAHEDAAITPFDIFAGMLDLSLATGEFPESLFFGV